jgi:peptidoglycan/xylan/chitin deacetylase (PgdA/CDA1 family)
MLGLLTPLIFLGQRQRSSFRQGLGVLTYHRLGSPPANSYDPCLYVSPNRFDEQLSALRQAALHPVSLSEATSNGAMRAGEVVVTFDDGFRSTLDYGYEILVRHKIRAAQFLVAGSLGGKNEWDVRKGDVSEPLMDETAVRDWLAAGHQIGSHSLTHPNLRKIPLNEAREEIFSSRKLLEDKFGIAVEHFCYPYGSYTPQIRDLVGEAGYRTACTTRTGANLPGSSMLELKRFIPVSSAELVGKAWHRLRRRFFGR